MTSDAPASTRIEVPTGFANLGMYPFADVRWAQERLWEALRDRVPWLPEALDFDIDPHASWLRPDLVLGQACGWPVATSLRGRVRVLGTFATATPQSDGHLYRSTIVARREGDLDSFAGATAAVNSFDSLSGWISLVAAVHGPGGSWEGTSVVTGAHVASLRALQEERADVAAIDGVTLWHVRRQRPDLVDGLVEVGQGPSIPGLPVITSRHTTDDQVRELRGALVDSVLDPLVEPAARALCTVGFVPLDADAYEPVLQLAPS
jgi:ABC-type phosphate/phosphonate transport system substrate-binding protein